MSSAHINMCYRAYIIFLYSLLHYNVLYYVIIVYSVCSIVLRVRNKGDDDVGAVLIVLKPRS